MAGQENFRGIVEALAGTRQILDGTLRAYPPNYGGIICAIRDLAAVMLNSQQSGGSGDSVSFFGETV